MILKNVTKVMDQNKKYMFKVGNQKTFTVFHFGDSLKDECYLQYLKSNMDQVEVYHSKAGLCK